MLTMRSITTLLLLIVLASSAAGCRSYKDGPSERNFASQSEPRAENGSRAYQTTQQYQAIEHNNSKMELSQPLIDVVQGIDGVNSAIVILTDRRYAYVAILLDRAATGTKGSRAGREVDNTGTSLGMYDPHKGDYPVDPRMLATGTNNYETVTRPEDLSHSFKQHIAEKIRLARPEVHDVFISANRDFVNRMNVYAQESWKGRSLDPYVPEFNRLVTQIFGTEPVHRDRNVTR